MCVRGWWGVIRGLRKRGCTEQPERKELAEEGHLIRELIVGQIQERTQSPRVVQRNDK